MVDFEDDDIEQSGEELGQEQQTEQKVEEQEVQDKGPSRDELMSEAMDEGVETAVIDELAEKSGELTIDDLRKLPGAEDMSDAELTAAWARAVKEAGSGQEQQAQTEQKFQSPFPVYDDKGNKLEKFTLEDLLGGKVQIGYNALGKEQRKTLQDALRNASLGHWNEQKYTSTLNERNQIADQLTQSQSQLKQYEAERTTWNAALTALLTGDVRPIQALAQAYQKAITQAGPVPGTLSPEQVRQEQEQQARGFEAIQSYIIPKGIEIAQKYGANASEVLGAINQMILNERQFFTKAKLDSILEYEIPQLLESNGYTVTAQPVQQQAKSADDVAELRRTVEALQAQLAGRKNNQTQQVRDRNKKVPPAGGGTTPGAGESMPSFKSRAQFKAWSQGDPDWARA